MALNSMADMLKNIRQFMKSYGLKNFQKELLAYVVLSSDAHDSEYVSISDQRRQFISGFSGSAGTAVITQDQALLWTDGRYYLQASQQLTDEWKLMKSGFDDVPTIEDWLAKELPNYSIVGLDPFYTPQNFWCSLKEKLKKSNKILQPIHENLVDKLWTNKPAEKLSIPFIHSIEDSGVLWYNKVQLIKQKLSQSVECLILSNLDEIAWLFNLRGNDIEYCPVFKAFASIDEESINLFIDKNRLTTDVQQHLNVDSIKLNILPYYSIMDYCKDLAKRATKKIQISRNTNSAIYLCFHRSQIIADNSPVCFAKSIKNDVELSRTRHFHIIDSAALCIFFHKLCSMMDKGCPINETEAAEMLLGIRKSMPGFKEPSFETISSSGPNCAVIHYKPEKSTARNLSMDEIYLCDSGGQYSGATTDITRTIHFGNPCPLQKECYTLVLKGHVNLASAVFPKKTPGRNLDILARKFLCSNGLDYPHGTGHGIGLYLNVHEGPQSITPKASGDINLEAGMVLSNEPGYYEDGCFGIRIENVIVVVNADTKYNFGGNGYLRFDTISLVPFDRKLIDKSLLSENEITWIDLYHQRCFNKVGNFLKSTGHYETYQWLIDQTIPL